MKHRGFVLIELIVVMGMLAVLIGMMTINTLGASRKASLTATIDTLIADLRSQQTKAMTGSTSGGAIQSGYGIRFESDRYILFPGLTYAASNPANSVLVIDPRVKFNSIVLPNNSVVFASRSGEIVGFSAQANTVTVQEIDSGELKTIYMNRYGVITSIN